MNELTRPIIEAYQRGDDQEKALLERDFPQFVLPFVASAYLQKIKNESEQRWHDANLKAEFHGRN